MVQYLISIHKQFPKIDPATCENEALRMAAVHGYLPIISENFT